MMKYRYCPQCTKPLEKLEPSKYQCPKGHLFFNNPKAAMGILFKRGGKYMFAVRAQEPQKGKLDVVGGFLDYNESALDAAVREIKEETGLTVRPEALRLIGTVTSEYEPETSTLALMYECTDWEGDPVAADDVADFVWEDLSVIGTDRYAWKSPDIDRLLQ